MLELQSWRLAGVLSGGPRANKYKYPDRCVQNLRKHKEQGVVAKKTWFNLGSCPPFSHVQMSLSETRKMFGRLSPRRKTDRREEAPGMDLVISNFATAGREFSSLLFFRRGMFPYDYWIFVSIWAFGQL